MKQCPLIKPILTLSVFVLFIGGLFLLNLLVPKPDVLVSERRAPVKMPELSAESLKTAEFMTGFGKYATDNFVFRDAFRAVRAASVLNVFMQTDKDGLYYDNRVGAGKFEKMNETSAVKVAEKIKKLAGRFPNLDVYYSIIPDKSVYADGNYPGFDLNAAKAVLSETLGGLTYIGLYLDGRDFYRTDLHWDQPELAALKRGGALLTLGEAMGFDYTDQYHNAQINTAGEFHGVYSGQLALPMPPDTMRYLTSDILDAAVVSYIDAATGAWVPGPMYDVEAVNGRDPYDLFLRGTQPLITIDNPSAGTERQLYLFRDSFSSSLAPLLTPFYSRITLIDMRYIDSRVLDSYITFAEDNADVLFLYGSQILNNSEILMVN